MERRGLTALNSVGSETSGNSSDVAQTDLLKTGSSPDTRGLQRHSLPYGVNADEPTASGGWDGGGGGGKTLGGSGRDLGGESPGGDSEAGRGDEQGRGQRGMVKWNRLLSNPNFIGSVLSALAMVIAAALMQRGMKSGGRSAENAGLAHAKAIEGAGQVLENVGLAHAKAIEGAGHSLENAGLAHAKAIEGAGHSVENAGLAHAKAVEKADLAHAKAIEGAGKAHAVAFLGGTALICATLIIINRSGGGPKR